MTTQVYFGVSLVRFDLHYWRKSTCNGNLSTGNQYVSLLCKEHDRRSLWFSFCIHNQHSQFLVLNCFHVSSFPFSLPRHVGLLLQLKKRHKETPYNNSEMLEGE